MSFLRQVNPESKTCKHCLLRQPIINLKIKNFYMVFLIFHILFSSTSFSSLSFENISEQEINKLSHNSFVLKSKKVSGKVWPEIHVKAYLKAKPLEAVAIFAAYDLQKTYVPNLVGSEVVKQEPPNEAHVDYKMDLPWPLGYSYYIHGHKLTQPTKNSYQVRWFLVKSDAADEVKGVALFEPYKDGSLMSYKAFVDPKSFFAGVLKDLMVKDVNITIQAIIDAIEKYRAEPKNILPTYKQKILSALNGKKAY